MLCVLSVTDKLRNSVLISFIEQSKLIFLCAKLGLYVFNFACGSKISRYFPAIVGLLCDAVVFLLLLAEMCVCPIC